jgi:hypothetical protein
MGDYLARILDFSWTVVTYWYGWVIGVPFLIDQLLSRNFWSRSTNERISLIWPEGSRHRFFKWLAAAGFIVSCFLAFDHVSSGLKDQIKISTALQTDNSKLQSDLRSAEYQLNDARRQLAEALKWRPAAPSKPGVRVSSEGQGKISGVFLDGVTMPGELELSGTGTIEHFVARNSKIGATSVPAEKKK